MFATQALQGVILKATAFEEHAHILTIFSREYGKISCVVKKKKSSNYKSFSPLLSVEAEILPSEKSLWKCKHLEVTNSHPKLRLNLQVLTYSMRIAQFLSYTLPTHTPLTIHYDEFLEFLTHIPQFHEPHVAATSFLAKFCLEEGLLGNIHPLSDEEFATSIHLANERIDTLTAMRCEKSLLEKLLLVSSR